MLRLLSAESYKLKKSKSFYISAIVMAALILLMYGMITLADNIQQGKMENGTAGITVTTNDTQSETASGSMWDSLGVMEMLQQTFSGNLVSSILAVFVSIFTIYEYGSGMIKNVVGKGCSRTAVFLSKLVSAILAAVIITLIGIAATLLCGRFFIGAHAFAGNFWPDFFIYIGLQLLLVCALAAVYVLVGEASRNLAAGISIGIGIAVFPALLFAGLDMACKDYGFTPSDFWVETRGANCPLEGFTAGYIAETALVAAFWFLLAAILGVWHFRKTDIK